MNPERWQRIQQLFDGAMELPSEARAHFLDAACGDDRALCDEVASLLEAQDRAARIDVLPSVWLAALEAPTRARFYRGQRVASRYRIRRLIGRGGTGEVYEAWDEELTIPVALKTLYRVGDDHMALRHLEIESTLARSVWHSNVCRVYDLTRQGRGKATVWCLAMELLEGETLAERLQRRGRFAPEEALPLALEMAAGLAAIHRAGVVHRDLKPGNVMLVGHEEDARAVVTDFGIAKTTGAAAPASVGTPAYMSPEQIRGEEAGPAADIFALGAVLYEMVTGRLPFGEGKTLDERHRRLTDDPEPPRHFAPELDDRWQGVILRALARDPHKRFQSVEDLGTALIGRAVPERALEVADVRHTLPPENDLFFGREEEIGELARHLEGDSRVVTLIGAGGMGKTRLAVHYARRSASRWPGGVWFCDLTQSRSAVDVVAAVAHSLAVPLAGGEPIARLGHAIAARGRCLLILDNFEQVITHADATLGHWRERAPDARFCVTSRERLGLEGEHLRTLEPLSLEQGVELFASRSRALRPGLRFEDADAQAIREIVRLADGMPLAIELASARMRTMTAEQILHHMRKRFHLLAGGRSAHHETLARVLDGSWELLRPRDRTAWAQCSVFEGGFTLDAAQAVLQSPPVAAVQALLDKSLLRSSQIEGARDGAAGGGAEVRFGMYVSLQEYARVKLRRMRSGGVSLEQATRDRHAQWYARFGTVEALASLDCAGGVERRRRLEPELTNLIAATRHAAERGDAPTAVAAYRAAAEILSLRGPYALATELGYDVLRKARPESVDRAYLNWSLGRAERLVGNVDRAMELAQEALALAREAKDRHLEGGLTGWLGVLLYDLGKRNESRKHYKASLDILRETGDRRAEGVVLGNLGIVHFLEGRLDEAQRTYDAGLTLLRDVGDSAYQGVLLGFLATLHRAQGRREQARQECEAALAIHREVGNRSRESQALMNLANLYNETRQFDRALTHYESAIAIAREVGDTRNEGLFLGNLGTLYLEQGQNDPARECFEAAIRIHRQVGTPHMEATALGSLGRLLHREGRTDEAAEKMKAAEEILRRVDRGLELAKHLCFRAEMEYESGEVETAKSLTTEAKALVAKSGVGVDSELGRMLARVRRMQARAPGTAAAVHSAQS